MVALTGNCSVALQKKLNDPKSFIIPCVIENSIREKSLGDSGASINVMLYTLFLKLGLEDL